ncbi:MAG TPA: oligosaccharide flippase family protein [Candidatus Saccharimonadia bacterium]|nr:oligosaccharide flippase family protein [Candidatus Saccharimonadia bacterium]
MITLRKLNRFSLDTKRLKTDSFYRHALIFTVASLAASGINYLYYPVMARFLNVSTYGELQVITSFILQLTTVYLSLNLINVNIVANHEENAATHLMTAIQKVIFWLVVVICVGLAFGSGALRNYFHFDSVWPFVLIVPILLIDTVSIFWTGYLQGHRQFLTLSAYTLTVALGKIIASVLLVLAGLSVSGGVLGIACGLVLGLVAVRLCASRPLPKLLKTLALPKAVDLVAMRGHLVYIVEVIVGLVSIGILLSVDVLLVKHFFSPQFAGEYAGIATVARIIFFASAPLVMVMLPSIKRNDRISSSAAFRRTLGLSLLICAAAMALFILFGRPIITLFMGPRFADFSSWLPLLSIIVVLATMTNIVVNYLLALRSHWAVLISISSLVSSVSLILWHHASVPQIVLSASLGLAVGQVIFWVLTLAKAY